MNKVSSSNKECIGVKIMKGFSGRDYKINAGDIVLHPDFYGHKNIEFTVTDYDIGSGEIVRNNGEGGKVLNLDICEIKSA
jgi:hypothetical protein